MAKYKKLPIVVEAFQWFSTTNLNDTPEWLKQAINSGIVKRNYDGTITIKTLEGDHLSKEGDYVIKGIRGELYPCKPDIFEQTYQLVE